MITWEKAYLQEVAEIEAQLPDQGHTGLREEQARQALATYGPNDIQTEKPRSLLQMLLGQFYSPMVLLLGAAAGLSFYFQEWLDGVAILIVLLVNGLIGFYMEWQANRSMNALKKLASVPAKVIRDGKLQQILSQQVVPGDLLFVEAGDMIQADARIIEPIQLEVDESALTGESLPIAKENRRLSQEMPLADRVNMLFKGTYVTRGNAKALVTATGMHTELGKIASLVRQAEQAATPLEKKLQVFSKKLIRITLMLVGVIFLAGMWQQANVVKVIETSIALAVAAIPEGLPIVATLALAQGMLRMARHQVIVKKLAAVETLGGTTVICTDKTGTLTENKIEVNTLMLPSGKTEILYAEDRTLQLPDEVSQNLNFELINQGCVLCNTANLEFKADQVLEVGDPLEVGLLKYAVAAGIDIQATRKAFPEVRQEAFTSETKVMGTLNKAGQEYLVFAKGAVEELLDRCEAILVNGKAQPLEPALRKEWLQRAEALAGEGLRLLGFAYRQQADPEETFMQGLIFLGVLGLLDPARREVAPAIAECKSAGIRVIMITGDHPATARNIGLKLGLITADDGRVLHGKDMKDYAALTPADKQLWLSTSIFARVTPSQKLDLVTLLQENKAVVGMTGDGVNDAPALKKADIGIAMGLRGTQVAQEVADMVLKDDSFSSIVVAIRQGRIIFENIKKFVTYLLSCNMSELFVVTFASLLSLHFALVPLQILFINLVTDVLPALALGVSEGSPVIMKNKPRDPQSQIISNKEWLAIGVYAAVISVCVLGAVLFSHFALHQQVEWNTRLCNNILFFTLIFSQLWHVFNMASVRVSIFKSEVVRNKYVWYALASCLVLVLAAYLFPVVKEVLKIYPMSYYDWAICLVFSLFSLIGIQLLKRTRLIL